jgi:hypothetical protein
MSPRNSTLTIGGLLVGLAVLAGLSVAVHDLRIQRHIDSRRLQYLRGEALLSLHSDELHRHDPSYGTIRVQSGEVAIVSISKGPDGKDRFKEVDSRSRPELQKIRQDLEREWGVMLRLDAEMADLRRGLWFFFRRSEPSHPPD